MSVAAMRMVGLALAVTLTVSCDAQRWPDSQSPKSKAGSTSTVKPKSKPGKPKSNPNPPPGVKHDIPNDVNADYSKKDEWERQVRSNCKKAGYARDCLILTYVFKKLEAGKLTPISDPGTDFFNKGFEPCTATKITPPTSNSKRIAPNTKVTVLVVCIPETKTSPSN
jgi:hypothetical protein